MNYTKRNVLANDWENNWQYASSIQIVATIAALLHDLGKSTKGFQDKLKQKNKHPDPYRHEWVSLKLFELLIDGCSTDEQWLSRFADMEKWLDQHSLEVSLQGCEKEKTNIVSMPPLAQWVAWLIVTHHRLPPYKKVFYQRKAIERMKQNTLSIKLTIEQYYARLHPVDFWVRNPKGLQQSSKFCESFWQCKQWVIMSIAWQKHISRWANKALKDTALLKLSQQAVSEDKSISDSFILYLSRLCLMVGDHNYSSLKEHDNRRKKGDKSFSKLAANTDKKTKLIRQALDEHLIGVSAFVAHFARNLPVIASSMPALKKHKPLEKNTQSQGFKWQNKAYQLALRVQQASVEHGFFGINMASTGCGKTIANARIMYALADPKKGARFTIALGLRVLTLQTGQSFRDKLHLTAEQLAILVGGKANRRFFKVAHECDADSSEIHSELEQTDFQTVLGSESSESLVDELLDEEIDYQAYEALNLGTVIESDKARKLLFAPVVTCTVDHIVQATECRRGGKYIAPMLRLLSSDLILDEPDDFDQSDLPALLRLVHLAGLLGSRILLSSATLTPDLLAGLFKAYRAGRVLFNRSQNKPAPSVVCAWFDEQENAMTSTCCNDADVFSQRHDQFTAQRARFLQNQPARRKAEILPLSLKYTREQASTFYAGLGQVIVDGAVRLHDAHHRIDSVCNKQVSIGLVRIANIKNITKIITQLLLEAKVPDDVHIHISCYHANQLLVLRNALENKLDRLLGRGAEGSLFQQPEIIQALSKSSAKQHIFIVMATPVAEVGRDHDYDWAIVEPSSMRSIIQLAGRVWRHRLQKQVKKANMLLLQYNIRYFTRVGINAAVFTRPGFEISGFKPHSYDLTELLTEMELKAIDARPRMVCTTDRDGIGRQDIYTFSGLEHWVMRHLFNNPQLNYVNAYWSTQATANRMHTHVQQLSPFRDDAGNPKDDWLFIPNDNGFDVYYAQDVYANGINHANKQNHAIHWSKEIHSHAQISPWLVTGLQETLRDMQQKQPEISKQDLLKCYATVSLSAGWLTDNRPWCFNEFLGFFRE